MGCVCSYIEQSRKRLPRLLVGFIGDIYYPSMCGLFREPLQIANIPMKQPGWKVSGTFFFVSHIITVLTGVERFTDPGK